MGSKKQWEEKMRDLSVGWAILLTFTLTPPALADYRIKLKNGRMVETAQFWVEKDEIKFQWPGGVASLPKKDLLAITEVEKIFTGGAPNGEKHPAPDKQETAPEPSRATVNRAGNVSPAERPSSAETSREYSVDYYLKQKAYYIEQFEQAYQRYLEASSRRDVEAKNKAWEEFNRFGGQVITLETELKRKNHGTVPSWRKEEKAKEGK
jgi:hypothetical protein